MTDVRERPSIDVLLPALNEEGAIGSVLAAIPKELVRHLWVVDNGSTDRTAVVAQAAGAIVQIEPRRGYGRACLAGLRAMAIDPPDLVVFLDADGSDEPGEMGELVAPIVRGEADLVIGSRTRGAHQRGALLPQAIFGNWLATTLIRVWTGVRFTDLGPFRAVRWSSLQRLAMEDPTYGWTVEMQMKAARAGLRSAEIPVRYRRRVAGESKVTGTIRGTLFASIKILSCLARYAFWKPDASDPTAQGDHPSRA
ncbi:MAG: glycosyltransferase family 2 protein [Candidatus Eisenbacteria bacterium]